MTSTIDHLDYTYIPETTVTDPHPQVFASEFLANFDPKFMPERNSDGTVTCPQCGRIARPQGFRPHWTSHRAEAERTLGLPVTPSRTNRKPKPEPKHREPKPVAVIEVPVVSVAEALASALAYALGERKLTVEQALDVHDWLVASEQFINSIRD